MFYSNFSLAKLNLCQILILCVFGISDSVVAASLDTYCISSHKPKGAIVKSTDIFKQFEENISIDGNPYVLKEVAGIGEIHLIDRNNSQIIYKLSTSFREKDESVSSLLATKSKWFIIHASKNNYMSRVLIRDVNKNHKNHYISRELIQDSVPSESKIILSPPLKLDAIYEKKCNFWRKFWDTCSSPYPSYSETLDRFFVSGYLPASSGHQWVTMEIIEDKEKILFSTEPIQSYVADSPSLNGVFLQGFKDEIFFYNGKSQTKLPKSIKGFIADIPSLNGALLQGSQGKAFFYNGENLVELETSVKSFRYDVSSLNGALLEGNKGEVLFYDGKSVVELSKEFTFEKDDESWIAIQPGYLQWRNNNILGERIFLSNLGVNSFTRNSKEPKIFMEFKEDLSLIPISFPEEIKEGMTLMFSFPNESRIWMVNKNGIYTEVDGIIQNVVTTTLQSYIPSPAFIEQLDDGSISFHVEKEDFFVSERQKGRNYFLTKVSPTANCKKVLNVNKAVILDPEIDK